MFDKFVYVAPFAVIYLTLFIGLFRFPALKLLTSGDYSYGVYLYGFPISQALMALSPGLFKHNLLVFLPTALLVTVLFAAFSWHVIEKHALAQKRNLPAKWFPYPKRQESFEKLSLTGGFGHVAVPAIEEPPGS
jgi:peptidoglycan/LPS O-acetylase OafA/YrhL